MILIGLLTLVELPAISLVQVRTEKAHRQVCEVLFSVLNVCGYTQGWKMSGSTAARKYLQKSLAGNLSVPGKKYFSF